MALDASERLCIRIVIFCCIGIIYLLCDKYQRRYGNYGPNPSAFSERDSSCIVPHHDRFNGLQSGKSHRKRIKGHHIEPSSGEWLYHKQKVEFLHPSVALQSHPKAKTYALSSDNFKKDVTFSKLRDHGLFALDNIPFGTVLSAEYPILDISFEDYEQQAFNETLDIPSYFHRIVQDLGNKDPEFKRVWDGMPLNPAHKGRFQLYLRAEGRSETGPEIDDYIRFSSTKFGGDGIEPWAVYSIIGRVGFNLPQNAMVVIAGIDKGHKALLITTRAITKGEEIVLDQFADWSDRELLEPETLKERVIRCQDKEFNLNQKWIWFIKQLQDRSLPEVQQHKLLLELYPNGLVGKDSEDDHLRVIKGCLGIVRDIKDCPRKIELTEDINSGNIFDRKTYESYNHHSVDGSVSNELSTNQKNQCPIDDKMCNGNGDEQDYLSKEHRLMVDRNRDEFEYDPDSVNDRVLMTHPIHTKFVHSALKLKYFDDDKQYGIITTKKVQFGSVLAVEYPMIRVIGDVRKGDMVHHVAQSVAEHKERDEHFKRIWNEELRVNKVKYTTWLHALSQFKKEIPGDKVMMDWSKFNTYWFGGIYGRKPMAIYSVLSRINCGIPQNVAAVFGDKTHRFVLFLIATRNLEEGEELQLDYLQNLHLKKGMSSTNEFGIKWTPELKLMLNEVHSDNISKKAKKRLIFEHLYSNGIIGKNSGNKLKMIKGCDSMTAKDCETKLALQRDIESGSVFSDHAAQWTGDEFIAYSKAKTLIQWRESKSIEG